MREGWHTGVNVQILWAIRRDGDHQDDVERTMTEVLQGEDRQGMGRGSDNQTNLASGDERERRGMDTDYVLLHGLVKTSLFLLRSSFFFASLVGPCWLDNMSSCVVERSGWLTAGN
jgi:hypothetical protein